MEYASTRGSNPLTSAKIIRMTKIYFQLNSTTAPLPNDWTENGQKYLLFTFSHPEYHIFNFGANNERGILLVPDDSSEIVNYAKNNLGSKTFYATQLTNLKFKPNFIDVMGGKGNQPWYYNGLLIKDTSQVEKLAGTEIVLPEITFKVKSQTKKKDEEISSNYSHELEIEPLDLGIEGMPKINHLTFNFFVPLQIPLYKPLTKSPLYNSNFLTESVGKTFTMKVKSFHVHNNALYFSSDWSFEWNSFQEKRPRINPNLNNQENKNPLKTVLIVGGIIAGGILVVLCFYLWKKKR